MAKLALTEEKGQMTVEFAVLLPVFLAVAAIAVNIGLFFSECSAFDRVARNLIRVHAASTTYDSDSKQVASSIEEGLRAAFAKPYLNVEVSADRRASGHMAYVAELEFSPTLFGMTLRSSVGGLELPRLRHRIALVLDEYDPGVLV